MRLNATSKCYTRSRLPSFIFNLIQNITIGSEDYHVLSHDKKLINILEKTKADFVNNFLDNILLNLRALGSARHQIATSYFFCFSTSISLTICSSRSERVEMASVFNVSFCLKIFISWSFSNNFASIPLPVASSVA